jgi:mRNA-degrading endonuclease RelE of RelBE toxin-antitoxin system
MDAIEKALKKLSAKERLWVKDVFGRLRLNKLGGLDVKKLQGRDDIFRIRKGGVRIIFRKKGSAVSILLIERRSEQTYGAL